MECVVVNQTKDFKKFYQEDNAKIQNSLDFGHDSIRNAILDIVDYALQIKLIKLFYELQGLMLYLAQFEILSRHD